MEYIITRKEAEKNNMEIWTANDGITLYARIQHGMDRDNPLYGYVYKITN